MDSSADDTGKLVHIPGLLLPAYYKPLAVTEFPWICPVRSCRRALPRLITLAGHIPASHHATTLNDNRDGTLSVLGTYTGLAKFRPPVIQSKNALGPEEPPAVEPTVQPKYRMEQAAFAGKLALAKELQSLASPISGKTVDEIMAEKARVGSPRQADEHSDSELSDLVSIPDSTVSPESEPASESGSESGESVAESGAAGALPTADKIMDRSLDDAGLNPVELETWKLIHARFTNKIIPPPQDGPLRELLAQPRRRDLVSKAPFAVNWPKDALLLIVQYNGEESPRPCHRCENQLGIFNGCVMLSQEVANALQGGVCSCVCCAWKSGNMRKCNISQILREQQAEDSGPTTTSSLPPPGDILDSYDEVVIKDADSDDEPVRPRTRQFKNALRTSTLATEDSSPLQVSQRLQDTEVDDTKTAVPRSADRTTPLSHSTKVDNRFTFEMHVIPPSTTLQLEVDLQSVRMCTLVSGKVSVKVPNEAAFRMGAQGMFKLIPGMGGEVVNMVGIDAVLHVSSLLARRRQDGDE